MEIKSQGQGRASQSKWYFDGDNYLNKPRKEEEIFPGGQIQVTKCKRCEVRQGEKETGLWGKKKR